VCGSVPATRCWCAEDAALPELCGCRGPKGPGPLIWANRSADTPSMDQFIILALLFVASTVTTLAAARGMLGLLLHLMTLGRASDRFGTSRQRTTASL
jgi:hypothetical protein